eukprot:scaffold78004_cov60-Phaeocystis_antarctica.AAC.4
MESILSPAMGPLTYSVGTLPPHSTENPNGSFAQFTLPAWGCGHASVPLGTQFTSPSTTLTPFWMLKERCIGGRQQRATAASRFGIQAAGALPGGQPRARICGLLESQLPRGLL